MEDLQKAVAGAMGMETPTPTEPQATQPTEAEPAPNQNAGTTDEQPVETGKNAEANAAPKEKETEAPKVDNSNSTIRQMREQIANEKKARQREHDLLQRIADSQGISVEQLEGALQEKEDKAKATQLGVSPEIAAQLRKQEARIKELEEETIRRDFDNRINNLLRETHINETQAKQFLDQLQSKGINPLVKGVDLTTLYRAVNYSQIEEQTRAQIRQDVLNEIQRQREAGNSIPSNNNAAQRNASTTNTNTETDADFINNIKNMLNK